MGKGLTITAFVFAFVFPLVGFILGIIAYKKSKNDPEGLNGLAIAAIVIGAVLTVIPLLVLLFVGLTWVQVRGTVESGSEQIEASTQCMTLDFRIDSANSATDTITISTHGGDADKIKIYVNSIEVKEEYVSSLKAGETRDFSVNLEPRDRVEIIPVVDGFVCPNTLITSAS